MHSNFFHWHTRVTIKPETSVLAPRWDTAAKFGENLTVEDVLALLRLVLLPAVDPSFAARFSKAMVEGEPTFPVENNTELLRVMAAAVVASNLDKRTGFGDAFALGLLAADFVKHQTDPVFKDVLNQAAKYLSDESERQRPVFKPSTLSVAKKKVDKQLQALQTALPSNDISQVGTAIEALGRGLMSALEESHSHTHDALIALGEESQCLWWLVGRRSPLIGKPRESLAPKEYALVAAVELVSRIELTPPPASAESLLEEALRQCAAEIGTDLTIADHVQATNKEVLDEHGEWLIPVVTPISCLIASGNDMSAFEPSDLDAVAATKVTSHAAGVQYFRELTFFNALALIA